MTKLVTRDDIVAAAVRIEAHVRQTPVLDLGTLISNEYELILKLEHLQVTGSFKPRGAFAVLTAVEMAEAGVVAASGGNFGIAVAHAASRLGVAATIFVPGSSPEEKIARIRELGADVHLVPGFYDDALTASRGFAVHSGAFEAHAYDQHEVVAGQGTIGMELAEQVDFDCVVVAVGGGGLIGGVASWLQADARVVAAEPFDCRSFNAAIRAGAQVEVEVGGVAASSLGARSVGDHAWAVRHWVDDTVVVTDESVVHAQKWLWAETRLAVEPAAATTVAALLTGAFRPERGSRVVAVLSGGNVDPATMA